MIREITYGGRVRRRKTFKVVSEAKAWHDEQKKGANPIPEDHTYEDVVDDDAPKRARHEAIKAVLDDDDFKDLILAWAKANPTDVPAAIKTKVQEALQA